MQVEQIVDRLEKLAVDAALPERDRSFADSLLNGKYGFRARGYLTVNQINAADRMITRIDHMAERPVDQAPAMVKVYAFLNQAKEHLKFPKLYLSMPGGGRTLKLYMSGARSKYPDTVNLVTDDNVWLGRVFQDGQWHHRGSDGELHDQAAELLKKLADDPAKAAAEYGHLTGHCSFCSRPLKDERSTDVGYGPVCAEKWGLPWG